MSEIENLSDTIKPKSDQLNADDLLTGPKVVTITKVQRGNSTEQPVWLQLEGGLQPYKPCKTMRRVLIAVWGEDGSMWVGRSMQLYCDPSVMYHGVKLGGVRISHVSGIAAEIILELTTARGKRSMFSIKPLVIQSPRPASTLAQIGPEIPPQPQLEQRVAAAVTAYNGATTQDELAKYDAKVGGLMSVCGDDQAERINMARGKAIERIDQQ